MSVSEDNFFDDNNLHEEIRCNPKVKLYLLELQQMRNRAFDALADCNRLTEYSNLLSDEGMKVVNQVIDNVNKILGDLKK